jgi:TolB protein
MLAPAASMLAGAAVGDPSGSRAAEEKHLHNITQLTFGGQNAEAYFSMDGKKLVLQSTRGDLKADQIFTMNVDGSDLKMVSTGKGRCTCSYWFPDGKEIVYCSTHLAGPDPGPNPDRRKGVMWKFHDGYDVFRANADGSNLRRLTDTPGYDAEAAVSPDGSQIVFTSTRDNGDPELYIMNSDGTNQRRLTNAKGYDGGPFFSWDSKMVCFRANRPKTESELAAYEDLVTNGNVRAMNLELYVINVDGTGLRQVTNNGAANFCPFFHPDNKRLIFASNMLDPKGMDFDLFIINIDGTGLERVTFSPEFDAFPMFSPDGKRLVWASNRYAAEAHDTNVFIADWAD